MVNYSYFKYESNRVNMCLKNNNNNTNKHTGVNCVQMLEHIDVMIRIVNMFC